MGSILVKLGFVRDDDITALLSRQYGVPSINLSQFEVDASIIKLVPVDTAQKYQVVPLARAGATLTIAMTDPTNVFAMDDIKFMTGYNVEPVVASETAVQEALAKYYAVTEEQRAERARDGVEGPRRHARRHRRRRPGARGARGDQRRGADEAGRRGAGHPPRQRAPDVGDPEGRERHPHRAVREGVPRPVPHRRRALQRDEPGAEVPRRHRVPPQDPGEAGHRRETAAAGRPHQDPLQRPGALQGNRLPRLGAADALRREDRPPPAGPRQADARHDAARVRARVAGQVRGEHPEAVGHGAGHGARRAAARRTRCTPRCRASTPPKRTS